MAVKGNVVGSIRKLRSAVKKGSGAGYLQRIKADAENRFRFLTEPTEWVSYLEHYDSVRKFYPCADDCPGCNEGDNPSNRFLANVVDMADGRGTVVPLVLPKTAAAALTKFYEKFNTLMDRDYSIDREGTGMDTEYMVFQEDKSKVKGGLDQFELIDLMAVLEAQLSDEDDSDDDEDDDDDMPTRRPSRTSTSRVSSKRRPVDDDDEDEDDDDDEPIRRRKPGGLKKPGQARREKEASVRAKKKPAPARKPLRRK